MHLRNQVVEPLQIDRGFLEPPLRGPPPVAVQTDASRFLEQLAPVIRTIGEQSVDHLGFDHDAGVGAETRAAQHVGDVAQPSRRTVDEVVAVTRP